MDFLKKNTGKTEVQAGNSVKMHYERKRENLCLQYISGC